MSSETVIVSNELLEDVKNYLNKDWKLDDTAKRSLTGMIKRGMSYLNNVAGTTLSYENEDIEKSLLLDYCRYADSKALEMFATNFQPDLLELNLKYQTERGNSSENQE